ncbi:hypothetical protein [Streptomyces spiramyceticus]|uniref:hypothetical protein n=1 Tax=Streptomyces spiramyceticus TaxID=299717 RepID=UPI00237A9682|nr:hypothetical protein [Streptomyces spiramyceticus]
MNAAPRSALADPTSAQPNTGEVFGYACAQIHRAAAALWPDATVQLGCHVPSVTGYVHRIRVNERELFAKHSMLGVSLVSVLRGSCGNWSKVAEGQQKYAANPDSLLMREAAQLGFLADIKGPRACVVAGVRHGVLFTEPVHGPSLTNLVLSNPGDTGELLRAAWKQLNPLHKPELLDRCGTLPAIGERSIAGTFLRKFNGISGSTYLDQLGGLRLPSAMGAEVSALLRQVVTRLLRIRTSVLPTEHPVLAYGDLKPEHVLYPDGPDARPVFLDPGLLRAGATVDSAKLISRTILSLIASSPGEQTTRRVIEGIEVFATALLADQSARARHRWLREVMALWLMDTVNITSTYLTAPLALPLPEQGAAVAKRAVTVCRMVDEISGPLDRGGGTASVWDAALDCAAGAGA